MQHNLKGTFPGDIVSIEFEEEEIGTNEWSVKLQSFVVVVDGRQLRYTFDTEDGCIISIAYGSLSDTQNPTPSDR